MSCEKCSGRRSLLSAAKTAHDCAMPRRFARECAALDRLRECPIVGITTAAPAAAIAIVLVEGFALRSDAPGIDPTLLKWNPSSLIHDSIAPGVRNGADFTGFGRI